MICSTFELQLKSTNMESNNSKSVFSSEGYSIHFNEDFSPNKVAQRLVGNSVSFNFHSNTLTERSTKTLSNQIQNCAEVSNQGSKICKLNISKASSLRKKTLDYQSYDTANLLCLMGKLRQIEDQIQ